MHIKLMQRSKQGSLLALGLWVALFGFVGIQNVTAQTSRSDNFEISEAEFGAGAALESCSGSYCAKATIGGTIEGESGGANFTAAFGSISADSEPMLELFIEPGQSDLGELATNRTATRTMLLHVRSHLAGGYTVQVNGEAPRFDRHTLYTPTEPIVSQQGREQFAMNVVANTYPEVGDDPRLMPADEILAGVATARYGTPDLFAYNSGDVVARTLSESSQIRYTVSMIINVAGDTPAGHYSGDFSAVVTPVF